MQIPPATDPRWKRVVLGKIKVEYSCLALKILLMRLQRTAAGGDVALANAAAELRDFFEKNIKIAEADLRAILSAA